MVCASLGGGSRFSVFWFRLCFLVSFWFCFLLESVAGLQCRVSLRFTAK